MGAGRVEQDAAERERQLVEERDRLAELIRMAPDAIFLSDAEGRCIEVNDAGCEFLGCTRAEILGKTIFDFISAQDARQMASRIIELRCAGALRFEWTLQRKDGSQAAIEVSTRVLPSGNRQSVVRDIPEGPADHRSTASGTDPEKTDGVKRVMALIAKQLRQSTDGSRFGKTNLQEFLS